jgi:hypothetical protein
MPDRKYFVIGGDYAISLISGCYNIKEEALK